MVYQGSKSRYAKYIVPILQSAIEENGYDTFIDGCCGGCNIIDKIKCRNRIAIDNNKYLIAFLNYIVINGTDFITEEPPSREEWNKVKNNKNNYPDWYVGYIEHLCSFNGRGFIGGYGVISSLRNQYQGRRKNILSQAKDLHGITFLVKDINDLVCKDCVIYIDPPYNHTKKYDSLVGNPFNYEKFWDTVRHLSQNNKVFVSEEAAPEDFEIVWSKTVERKVGDNKKIAIEGLFKLKS